MTEPTTAGTSLAEAYLVEQARCRGLLGEYRALGPVGVFAYAMINEVLTRAERAVMEHDTVAMLGLFQEMKGFQ